VPARIGGGGPQMFQFLAKVRRFSRVSSPRIKRA
jgi:hypothetical protein